jgi:hypothetical protein
MKVTQAQILGTTFGFLAMGGDAMPKLGYKHFMVPILLAALLLTGSCVTTEQKTSQNEINAFFVAAKETNYLGVECFSAKQMDLSGYAHLTGTRYPPTQSVDLLSAPPSRPHQVFAVLETPLASASTADADTLRDLKLKARSIGADAVVLCRPSEVGGLAGPQNSTKMIALAIKYRLEDLSNQTKYH